MMTSGTKNADSDPYRKNGRLLIPQIIESDVRTSSGLMTARGTTGLAISSETNQTKPGEIKIEYSSE